MSAIIRPFIDERDMVVIASSAEKHILPDSEHVIYYDSSKKANVTINILLNALDRKFDVTHLHKVY